MITRRSEDRRTIGRLPLVVVMLIINLVSLYCSIQLPPTVFRGEVTVPDDSTNIFEVVENRLELSAPADGGSVEGTFYFEIVYYDETIICVGDAFAYSGTLVGSFDGDTYEMNGRGSEAEGSVVDASIVICGELTTETDQVITWVAEYDEASDLLVGAVTLDGTLLFDFSATVSDGG